MTNIEPYKGKRPIMMRSGIAHWVSEETANRLEDHIEKQQAHGFIRIKELGLTLNTADVEGVYTVEQYNDYCRMKQGEWQCAWKKWHGKKEICECEKDARKRARDEAEREHRAKVRAEAERPMTEEEKRKAEEAFIRMNEEAVLGGSEFMRNMYTKGNRSGRRIRRSTIERWERERGPVPFKDELMIWEDTKEEHEKEVAQVIT